MPVRDTIFSISSSSVNSPSSLYKSICSFNFFLLVGRFTATDDQKCLRPVNLSSITTSAAPDRINTSKAFLFSLEYTISSLKINSSTVAKGRCANICTMALSPKPFMELNGCMSVILSSGLISHTIPETFKSAFSIVKP